MSRAVSGQKTVPVLLAETNLSIEGLPDYICRIYQIAPMSLTGWLLGRRPDNRFYFAGREGDLEVAAAGNVAPLAAQQITALTAFFGKLGAPFFLPALFPFEEQNSVANGWEGFLRFPVYLPRRQIIRQGGRFFLVELENGEEQPNRTAGDAGRLRMSRPVRWKAMGEEPAFPVWEQRIATALKKIEAGELQKIVLSRRWKFEGNGELTPECLLNQLGERREGYRFWFQPDAGRVFWGNSPERLFRREGRNIFTEALAGTRSLEDAPDLQALSRELSGNPKELAEHREVSRMIERELDYLCSDWECRHREKVVRHISVLHLATRYRGTLRSGKSDLEVLQRLHPTPAVAGMPVAAARRQIAQIEKEPRGLYSGVVGVIGNEISEFAVAIRSALWQSGRVTLFGGAGIVAGSSAKGEWEETRAKMKTVLKIMLEADNGHC